MSSSEYRTLNSKILKPKTAKHNHTGHCEKLGRNSFIIENSFTVLHLKSLYFIETRKVGHIGIIQEK